MKTTIVGSLLCFFALSGSAEIKRVRPLNFIFNKWRTQAYNWIKGSSSSFKNYMVEILIPSSANSSLPAALRCTAVADSIYVFTRIGGLAQNKFTGLSQFVNTLDKVSTDGKWRTVRDRILKTIINLKTVFHQAISLFLKMSYGNQLCTPGHNTEIANEII